MHLDNGNALFSCLGCLVLHRTAVSGSAASRHKSRAGRSTRAVGGPGLKVTKPRGQLLLVCLLALPHVVFPFSFFFPSLRLDVWQLPPDLSAEDRTSFLMVILGMHLA